MSVECWALMSGEINARVLKVDILLIPSPKSGVMTCLIFLVLWGLLVLDWHLPHGVQPCQPSLLCPRSNLSYQLSSIISKQHDALWQKLLVMVLSTSQAYHTALEEQMDWWAPLCLSVPACAWYMLHRGQYAFRVSIRKKT